MTRTRTTGKDGGDIVLETANLAVSVRPELGGGLAWFEDRSRGVRLGLSRAGGSGAAGPAAGRISFIDRFPADASSRPETGGRGPAELGDFALRPYHAEWWGENGGSSMLCSRKAAIRVDGTDYPFLLRKLYQLPAHSTQLRIRTVLDDLTPLSAPFRYGVEFSIVGSSENPLDSGMVLGPPERRGEATEQSGHEGVRWMRVGLGSGGLAVRLAFSGPVTLSRRPMTVDLENGDGVGTRYPGATFLATAVFGPEQPPTYALELLLELMTGPGQGG